MSTRIDELTEDLASDLAKDRMNAKRPKVLIRRKDIPNTVRKMTGRPSNPHEQTVRRWYTRGIAGVKLEIDYIGGEVFTTREALVAFFEGVTFAKLRRHAEVASGSGGAGAALQSVEGRAVNPRLARMAQDRLLRRLGRTREEFERREAEIERRLAEEGSDDDGEVV